MTKKLKLLSLIACASLVTGCAIKSGNEKLEDATSSSVSPYIVKDQTTKANVRDSFGEPQKVDFLSNGLEKWEFEHIRKNAKLVNFVPVVNWFVGGTNDTKKSLVILFDGEIVKNYTIAVAEGETKAGLLQ